MLSADCCSSASVRHPQPVSTRFTLANWPLWRVLLIAVCWMAAVGGTTAVLLARAARMLIPSELASSPGETVVGVSAGAGHLLMWIALLFGPPLILLILWMLLKAR
jgi:hypothetical protein